MIAVDHATLQALNSPAPDLALRVRWDMTREGGVGVDVSDHVASIAPVHRDLQQWLGGFSLSDCNIVLRNDDGILTPGIDASHLRSGPATYNMTKVIVEQGVRRADGTFEYVPVFGGRIRVVEAKRGQIEIRVASNYSILATTTLPEDYGLGEYHSSGIPRDLTINFPDLITDYTPLTVADDLDASGDDYRFCTTTPERMGWSCNGTIRAGTSIGRAVERLARSCLMTPVEHENGLITLVSEVLPRVWCSRTQESDEYPERFDEDNSAGFSLAEAVGTTATEVVVTYQGTAVFYRNTTDESASGRLPRVIDMEYCSHGHCAAWAARVIYESHKQFPAVVSFAVPVERGLLVQLNDRIWITDPMTGAARKARVVSKSWAWKSHIEFVAVVNSAEAAIFDGTFAVVENTSWDDGTEIAL